MAKNIINHVDTYNDHSKSLTINASSVDIPNILRAFMAEDVEDITPVEMTPKKEQAPYEAAKKEQAYTPPVPREGDYNGVRLYIEERKKYDEQFNDYCLRHNRKELCSFLTKEFGWFVDDKSLGRNIQRNI